jgi:hypothetical protein
MTAPLTTGQKSFAPFLSNYLLGAIERRAVCGSQRGDKPYVCSHVAFLDQDDIWYSDHVSVLKKPFLKGEMPDLALSMET